MHQTTRKILLAMTTFMTFGSALGEERAIWTLDTPNYKIRIVGCPYGDFMCVDAKYFGKHKWTGKKINLTGMSYTLGDCNNAEESNCRWGGFLSKTGPYEYQISRDGQLIVSRNKQSILTEQGKLEESLTK